MGLESTYIALPAACVLVKRSENDPAFGEFLGSVQFYKSGGHHHSPWPDPIEDAFRAVVQQMNQAHPGIASRIFTLDRNWDSMHYILSENRRKGVYQAEDWGTKAVRGASKLSEHLTGGQGIPIRYTAPEEVLAIAARMQSLTQESLRLAYDPQKMQETVYKFNYHDAEKEWSEIWTCFNGLKAFYEDVARHEEAVMVCID